MNRLSSISPTVLLQPGNVIELGNIRELSEFEDMVALGIHPEMSRLQRDAWAGRTALKDCIRPAKFNGTIADIRLEVMHDSYERLLDARERGFRFPRGVTPRRLTGQFAERLSGNYRGFILVADATSAGRGTIGQIQTELWYAPVPLSNHQVTREYTKKSGEVSTYSNRHIVRVTRDHGGASVRRYVANPKLESENFIKLDEESRLIGLAALRESMMHPIVQPMHQ